MPRQIAILSFYCCKQCIDKFNFEQLLDIHMLVIFENKVSAKMGLLQT